MIGRTDPKYLDDWDLQDEIERRRAYVEEWSLHLMDAIEGHDAQARHWCVHGLWQHHVRLRALWAEHERRAGRSYRIVTGWQQTTIPDRVVQLLRAEWERGKVTQLSLSVKYGISKSYAGALIRKERRVAIAS